MAIGNEFIAYYNRWRPHPSLGQLAPYPKLKELPVESPKTLIAKPVLVGLHHVYQWAALQNRWGFGVLQATFPRNKNRIRPVLSYVGT